MKKNLFRILHLFIIISFVIQIIYTIIAFFNVAQGGLAGTNAGVIPQDEMLRRRLYGIELWISISGLAIYLGVVYHNALANCFKKGE